MKIFLHPWKVLQAIYYGQRWRLKQALRIPERPRNPVVDGDSSAAFSRHFRICNILKSGIESLSLTGRRGVACEIGCGDCLSTADLLLGSGFDRVYLVEKQAIVLDQRQHDLLKRLGEVPEFPNRMDCIATTEPFAIDKRIAVIREFFENAVLPEKVDLLFSHDVLEHVEDLTGFFTKCAAVLRPGGTMIHKFDLSGHEFFEDPMPPLDFQTYPDWLYSLMYPKYRRATRYFLDEHLNAMAAAGFEQPRIQIIRAAEDSYVRRIQPHLRTAAQTRTIDQLSPLDVLVCTNLPMRGA